VQERARNTLEHTGIDNNLFSRMPVAQKLRERMDKCDYMKLKSFCTKEMVTRLKRQPTENLCQLYI
jgi:hypothetical protein